MYAQNENQKFIDFVEKNLDRMQDHALSDDKLINKIILLVSTGAFGLSINFYINSTNEITSPIWLEISWATLALTIILNLIGYFISRTSREIWHQRVDSEASNPDSIFTGDDYNRISNEERNSTKTLVLHLTNWLVLEFFIIGIVTLTIFAIKQI